MELPNICLSTFTTNLYLPWLSSAPRLLIASSRLWHLSSLPVFVDTLKIFLAGQTLNPLQALFWHSKVVFSVNDRAIYNNILQDTAAFFLIFLLILLDIIPLSCHPRPAQRK